ncbi:hypothetical protein [Noviherbaspirillum sp.]|uniref:hypothetical protein n=1 Tax=Noviherbaspirillum sp. TaxID=1926288 RepID=UPI002FE3BB69
MRRELGVDLARAVVESGVDTSHKRRTETPRRRGDMNDALLYFTSFEQFDAWHTMTFKK